MTASAQTASQTGASFWGRWLRPFIFYVVPILVALVVVLAISLSAYSVLPRLRVSPGYSLVDQDGQVVSSEDMRGGVVLYSLASTNCLGECQESMLMLDAVQERLTSSGLLDDVEGELDITFVTIFTEASSATPERLRDFAANQQLGRSIDWALLTGDETRLNALLQGGFGLEKEGGSSAESSFTPALVLVDEAGFVRAEYLRKLPESRLVADDIASVVDEARAGGFGAAAYGASHKFTFTCNAR